MKKLKDVTYSQKKKISKNRPVSNLDVKIRKQGL